MRRDLPRIFFTDASFVRFKPGSPILAHKVEKGWVAEGGEDTALPRAGYKLVQFYGGMKLSADGSVLLTKLIFVPPTPGVEGKLDSKFYQDSVCAEWARDIRALCPDEDVLVLQDGARPHTAATTLKWWKDRNIQLVEHPPQSPDLNPIERAWCLLKKKVHGRKVSSIARLQLKLETEWQKLDRDTLRDFVEALPSVMGRVHSRPDKHVNC
jgi:hypothetical protein